MAWRAARHWCKDSTFCTNMPPRRRKHITLRRTGKHRLHTFNSFQTAFTYSKIPNICSKSPLAPYFSAKNVQRIPKGRTFAPTISWQRCNTRRKTATRNATVAVTIKIDITMKKVFLTVALAAASLAASAQVYVGGEVGFWRNTDANTLISISNPRSATTSQTSGTSVSASASTTTTMAWANITTRLS